MSKNSTNLIFQKFPHCLKKFIFLLNRMIRKIRNYRNSDGINSKNISFVGGRYRKSSDSLAIKIHTNTYMFAINDAI